ncbi:uncharacterized protein TNCV_3098501 [Trichonephila clavipes]|nr:uncharacterized protein TNCV_3098501 [Trichonephila clavipes]
MLIICRNIVHCPATGLLREENNCCGLSKKESPLNNTLLMSGGCQLAVWRIGHEQDVHPYHLQKGGVAAVPSRHGGTLNSRRAANPFVRLVEEEERWETPTLPQGVLQNWGGTKPNRTVTCMVLKATANDWRTSSPLP